MRRRDFLKVGMLGTGLSLSQYFRLAEAGAVDESKRQSAILIFLSGGPSHLDTFDLKPDAPSEYRGEFRPIPTNVSGVQICEHLPRLARCADKFALINGVTHNIADHGLGSRYLLTGSRPGPILRHPTYGSVVSKELECRPDLPPFVSVNRELEGPGYLGIQYGGLMTGEFPRTDRPFNVRGISLGDGLTVAKMDKRRRLRDDLDTAFRDLDGLDEQVVGLDKFAKQAYQIITSPRTRAAFDVDSEKSAVRERFGKHEFGQSFLLACRLVEAGVRFVTVIAENWDTHEKNFQKLQRTLLPALDEGLSALLGRLSDKGLLETTAVMATGEFGRTPKVNENAGRDHWPRAMSVLMAGSRVEGGQVVGSSDDKGVEPRSEAWTPDDVAASFYHNIGIDPRKEYITNTGRPVMLVRDGKVIPGLF